MCMAPSHRQWNPGRQAGVYNVHTQPWWRERGMFHDPIVGTRECDTPSVTVVTTMSISASAV
jgi:hypothetical protein